MVLNRHHGLSRPRFNDQIAPGTYGQASVEEDRRRKKAVDSELINTEIEK